MHDARGGNDDDVGDDRGNDDDRDDDGGNDYDHDDDGGIDEDGGDEDRNIDTIVDAKSKYCTEISFPNFDLLAVEIQIDIQFD